MQTTKINYGIDAPNVIRNLSIAAIITFIVSVFFPVITIGSLTFLTGGLIYTAFACAFGAIIMLRYRLVGKFKHRDKMLNLINWRGDEQVLDVGTGRGLLMIGAAKKLSTGKSIGIDIWNAEDLSDNAMQNTLMNAQLEGVTDKIEILNEDAQKMPFADASFDVVFGLMCLHNIYNKPGRAKACSEILRVLKKGGTAVISDYKLVHEYADVFRSLGATVEKAGGGWFSTIIKVQKI